MRANETNTTLEPICLTLYPADVFNISNGSKSFVFVYLPNYEYFMVIMEITDSLIWSPGSIIAIANLYYK